MKRFARVLNEARDQLLLLVSAFLARGLFFAAERVG